MWTLLELIVLTAIVLVSVTEFFIPLILGKPLFGSFRKFKAYRNTDISLVEKISKAKSKVYDVKVIQMEVTKNYKSAEQLKEESDNLLK